MEKRVFLAIFLSFLILALYQTYVVPPPPDEVVPVGDGLSVDQPAGSPADRAESPTASPEVPIDQQQPAPPGATPLVADTAARDIVVDTDDVRAVFSSAGAILKSWQLKHYTDDLGRPLDLVPGDLPPSFPKPFTLETDDIEVSATLSRALFRPNVDGLTLGSSPGTLSFQYRDDSGLNAQKTFHFQPDGKAYVVNVEATVDIAGTPHTVTLDWGLALGLGFDPNGGSRITPARGLLFRDGGFDRLSADTLLTEPVYDGQFRFAGVEDHYFLSVAIPETTQVEVRYQPVSLPIPGDEAGGQRTFVAYRVQLSEPTTLPFFIGPKDFEELRGVDAQFVRAIDFGVFAWLVVPLLQSLRWVNGYIANYGFSIIALTILINLAIFPLRHRSMVSMRKMQALQPHVQAIQERYKKYKITDPERQKMNQEMMALYKQKGVNPASGCVPMLLTMPILFAFYAMLSVAIEIRHAPFVGWITDLAAPDPLYITPVLMGATMVLQQRMMPSTADPVQKKIFMMMPVMFTAFFLWAPSGLVLYWLMSNIMAIGQQYITNSMIGPPPTKPAATDAKPAGTDAKPVAGTVVASAPATPEKKKKKKKRSS